MASGESGRMGGGGGGGDVRALGKKDYAFLKADYIYFSYCY